MRTEHNNVFSSEKSTPAPSVTVAVGNIDMTHEKHDHSKGSIKCQTNILNDRYDTELQVSVRHSQMKLKNYYKVKAFKYIFKAKEAKEKSPFHFVLSFSL